MEGHVLMCRSAIALAYQIFTTIISFFPLFPDPTVSKDTFSTSYLLHHGIADTGA